MLDGVDFQPLFEVQTESLSGIFTMEEAEEAVESCEGNKAPGPDGFNFNFIKKYWGTIKQEVWDMVQEFFVTGKLPKMFSSYFLALVPKCKNPQGLGEYRPISLLGCIYKILAKMLAGRLKKVMSSIIATNKSAFSPNRFILDGVLIINEVVDFAKKWGESVSFLRLTSKRLMTPSIGAF